VNPVGGETAYRWHITLTCPLPPRRCSTRQQAWHLEPERLARTVSAFFAGDAELHLTGRTARLTLGTAVGDNIGAYCDRAAVTMASLLSCLYFDTHVGNGRYALPSPVRMEIVQRQQTGPKTPVLVSAQVPPTDGDQVT
jgi:hypothetical protein